MEIIFDIFKLFLDSNFAVLCITLLLGFITACLTYRSAKKLKFFEVYFRSKVDSYNDFFEASKLFLKKEMDEIVYYNVIMKASVYASNEAYKAMFIYFNTIMKLQKGDKSERLADVSTTLIKALRSDIDHCRNFKYR